MQCVIKKGTVNQFTNAIIDVLVFYILIKNFQMEQSSILRFHVCSRTSTNKINYIFMLNTMHATTFVFKMTHMKISS